MNTADIGLKVTKVLDSIVSNDYIKKLTPSLSEMNQNMARMVQQGKHWQPFKVDGSAANALEQSLHNAVDGRAMKIASTLDPVANAEMKTVIDEMNISNMEESFKKMYKFVEGNDVMKNKLDYVHDEAKKVVGTSSTNIESILGTYNYKVNLPKAYFSNPDKDIRNARFGAVAGAYAGITVGSRIISGGTLTADSYGRKDIAGVPFI